MKLSLQRMALVPYVLPATRHARFKLDLNESPLVLPAPILQCFTDLSQLQSAITFYPVDEEVHHVLLTVIADQCGVLPDNLLLTAGSDEALRLIADTYCKPGDRVCAFTPTYTYALQWFISKGCQLVTQEWSPERVSQLSADPPKILYLCTPNNPDGRIWEPSVITELARVLPTTLIIVDEAYVEFGGESVTPLVQHHSNLLVTRTFSKAYGLAGMRIGYLVANRTQMTDLKPLHNPKAVTHLAKCLALCALTTAYREYQQQIKAVMAARQQLQNHLQVVNPAQLELLTASEGSGGNFLFLRAPHSQQLLSALLEQKGIALRDRSSLVKNSFRITMGDESQMKYVFHALCQLALQPTHLVQVVVLAAGSGTRIQAFWDQHKCLLAVRGETLLARLCRQVRKFFGTRLQGITVVTGYKAENLQIATAELGVQYIYNPAYHSANNWRSMLAGLQVGQGTVLALDGDLLLADELVQRLTYLHEGRSLLVVDSSVTCDAEAMKAYGKGAIITELSKEPPSTGDPVLGEFIGVTVIAPQDRATLIDELQANQDRNEYYEHAWTRALAAAKVPFSTLDTWNAPWCEVDTQEDYHQALTTFV
jgi:histidinol-phosphate aminotransferase